MPGVNAANYYVDPVNGDMANDGSPENHWKTLAEVFTQNKAFETGDTIFLLSGHHGIVTVKGINTGYVTILPLEGHQPTMKKLSFNSAERWKAFGLTISPETADAGTDTGAPNIDKDGQPRPQGSAFDVGTYEYPGGPDTISPELLLIAVISPGEIELFFSEQLKIAYAQNNENYSIDNGTEINETVLSENNRVVTLAISELGEGITYMLTVSNIQDLAGNVIEPGSSMIPAVPLNIFSDIPYYGIFPRICFISG